MTDLERRLEADAKRAAELAPDLWARIDADLSRPDPLAPLTSLSTPIRRLLGASGILAFGVGLVGAQGIREDLDSDGWTAFALWGGLFLVGSLTAASFALRNRAARPLPSWPWLPLTWAFLVAGTLLPWPGVTGIPRDMHLWCFETTSVMVVLSTLWLSLLERGRHPVPWRVALAAAASGLAAFTFQSVFCPGVDLEHLLLGHGGAGIAWAFLALIGTLVLRRR